MGIDIDNPLYRNLLDGLNDGVYLVDRERRILFWSKAAENISGFRSYEVTGLFCWDDLLMHVDERGVNLCKEGCPLSRTLADGVVREARVYLRHKEGHRVPVQIRTMPVCDEKGAVVSAIEVFNEASDPNLVLQRAEELQQPDFLDPLTGLAKRWFMEEHLEKRVAGLASESAPFGLLLLAVDHFDKILDYYRRDAADHILRIVARTLLKSCRSFDVMGRWGEAQILACIENVRMDMLCLFAERYRTLVEQSNFSAGAEKIRVTLSVGAVIAQRGDTQSTLVGRAADMLARAVEAGGNHVTA